MVASVRPGYVPDVSGAAYSADDGGATLRARVARGTAWSMAASVATLLARTIVAVLLARLLTPAQYGLAGMALVFTALVMLLSDLSLGAALVQRTSIDEDDRSTVFWITVAVGILLTLTGVALSGPIATFFKQPRVQPLLAVLSISFLLLSLQTTQASLLQREMRFRAIATRLTSGVVVGGVVGVTAAALGAGAWALIAQQLAVTGTSTVLLWMQSSWRPRFVFAPRRLRSLGGFGLRVFGSGLVNYINRNTDNVLVGRYLGSGALGAYSVAYNVILLPITQLTGPLQSTLFPAYASIQHDAKRVADIWLRVTTVVTGLVAPAMVGLAIVAPDFVHVLLGHRWQAATPVVQILAFVSLGQAISGLGWRVLQAMDRAGVVLNFSLGGMVLTVASFVVGLRWGIVGVAASYACVAIPIAVVFAGVAARALDVPLIRLWSAVRGAFESTLLMAAALFVVRAGLAGQAASVRLAVLVFAGAAVYVPVCAWRVPLIRAELGRLHRRLRSAR